mgnify:CR=1 FL=1
MAILCSLASPAAAAPALDASRLDQSPVIDGDVADDAAWANLSPVSGFSICEALNVVASKGKVISDFRVPGRITAEALNGDHIMVDGEQGIVHLRPEETVVSAFREKIAMLAAAQKRYASIRDKPAETTDGAIVSLQMNAGLMADLPSLPTSITMA